MNINFSKLRWPYRDDAVFSTLSFIVLVVPLAFCLFTNENFETIKFALWLAGLGLALLLWLWQQRGRKIVIKVHPAILGLAGGLVLWALVSALFAPDKLYAFFGFYYRYTNGFLFMLLWAVTVLLLAEVADQPKWVFLMKLLAFDALLVALKSIVESLGLTLYLGSTPQAFFRAAPSFLGNPNFSAMFMAAVLPFVGVFWRQCRSFAGKIFYGLSGAIILGCLAILASRGALIALVGGVVVFFVLLVQARFKRSTWLKSGLAVVLLVAVAVTIVRISRPNFFSLQWRQDDNIDFRLKVWQQSWQGITTHPLAGVGLGNFALFQERLPRPPLMNTFDDPHNLWIFLAATGGWPFLLLFTGLVGFVAWQTLGVWRRSRDLLAAATLVSLAVFAVAAAFTPVSTACFLLLALLLAGQPLDRGRELVIAPIMAKILAGVLAVVAVAFITWSVLLTAGETALHFGFETFNGGNLPGAQQWLLWSRRLSFPNERSHSYYIQTETIAKQDPAKINVDIAVLKKLHPAQASSYVLVSNADLSLAVSLKDDRYLDAAIAEMQHSLEIDPSYPERYGQLGFDYYLKQDYPQALRSFDQSLALEPNLLPSLILEAKIYQLQKDRPRLLAILDRAYKLYLDDPRVKLLWFAANHDTNVANVPLDSVYSLKVIYFEY